MTGPLHLAASLQVVRAVQRIETRRWLAERMLPKVYAAKTGLEMSGGGEVKQMGRVEIAHRVSILMAIADKRRLEQLAHGDLA